MNPKNLRTVKQLVKEYPAFTEWSIRYFLRHAVDNGLESATVRIGRKLYIDMAAFDKWIEKHQAPKLRRKAEADAREAGV